MKEIHVLNLGAGVQSTMVYLLATMKHPAILEHMPRVDFAVFADTGEEPQRVYDHLEWLKSLDGPEILMRSTGSKLGDDLINGVGKTRRFSALPVFSGGGSGRGPRHCSRDYKINVIEKCIRQEIVGLKPRQRFPVDDVHIHQYLGLSMDEASRVLNVRKAFMSTKWATPHFPLFDTNTDRTGAKKWLTPHVPHETPRSACTFCPCHDNAEWRRILNDNPFNPEWCRAVEIDHALRDPNAACSRGRTEDAFLHRSCVPLERVDLTEPEPPLELAFRYDCMGMCGV